MSIKQSFIGAYARQRAGRRPIEPDHHDRHSPIQDQPQTADHQATDDATAAQHRTAPPSETQTWVEGKDDQVLRIDQPAIPAAPPTPDAESLAAQWLATESHVITAPMLDPNLQAAAFDPKFIDAETPDAKSHQSPVSQGEISNERRPQTAEQQTAEQQTFERQTFEQRAAEQHVAKQYADVAQPNIDATLIEPTRVEAPEVDIPSDQVDARLAAPPTSTAAAPEATFPDESVINDSIAESSNHTTPASRWNGAAWEVDAFSIPRHVADTFFEEKFFRSIADHLGQSVRSGLRSILVTSLCDGEGRSTTSLGTAIAAAATGLSVAIIDVDLDHPGQAEQLRLDIESDWVTAIRQGQPLESVAVASLEDGVTLLPLLYSDESSVPATSMDLDRLIDHLHGCFDLILFDGPAVNSWATARLASAVDSCLIVRDARLTGKSNVALAAATLRRQGVQGIGVVDNFT